MKVAPGVEALALQMSFMGSQRMIYPTLIWDETTAILVDTGMPGQLNQIEDAMKPLGLSLTQLKTVILTHQDIDHIGGLPNLLQAVHHKIDVLAHEADKPYIEGDKPPLKMTPERVAKMLESLPEAERAAAEKLFGTPPRAEVDRTISDGEILPFCGGITVIFTPGHTPGHISLYLHQSKVLVTGDAIVSQDGKLFGPNPQNTPDMAQAKASLKKFTNFDVQTIICYHGGLVTENANQQLADAANE